MFSPSSSVHCNTIYRSIVHVHRADCPLSSLHRRVLLRCGRKYEDGEEADPERRASARLFVVLTSGLILLGITYSFWLKNFSSYSQYFH